MFKLEGSGTSNIHLGLMSPQLPNVGLSEASGDLIALEVLFHHQLKRKEENAVVSCQGTHSILQLLAYSD